MPFSISVAGQNSCHCVGQNSWRGEDGPEFVSLDATRDTNAPARHIVNVAQARQGALAISSPSALLCLPAAPPQRHDRAQS